ncbi:MAG TPA: C40 family peptidase [Pilimelia sp.]|nr:C40 family peptidase [Pilimelia sp.]
MANGTGGHNQRRWGGPEPTRRWLARGAVVAAVLVTAATLSPVAGRAAPEQQAEPAIPSQVPDGGARPVPAGRVVLPGGGLPTQRITPVTSSGLGPLAAQITAAEAQVAALGEQLKQVGIERTQVRAEIDILSHAYREATEAVEVAEAAAESAAEKAYKEAAGLLPGTIGSDLHGIGSLPRLQRESAPGSEATARELARAQEAEQAAYRAYKEVLSREEAINTRYAQLEATFKQRERALLDLRQRHVSELAAIEREREANEQRLGAGYVGGDTVAGKQADPKAKAAVRFALAQLGEPYLWGAEGPDRWDCSGLMYGAYASVGRILPRVSRDQYAGTRDRRVDRHLLLPGDLLFFATSSTDARSIHHVGMYIGNGKMVHSPTTGDVVKISTVWWSRFFDATRVFDAVPAATPAPPAPPPPPANPNPSPTPKPSTTPKPSPSPKPSPTTPPPTTPPASPSPSPTEPAPTSNPPATSQAAEPSSAPSSSGPTAPPATASVTPSPAPAPPAGQ